MAAGLAGAWLGPGVPSEGLAAICLALGKGHGDEGLAPPVPTLVALFLRESGLVAAVSVVPTGSLLLFLLFLSPWTQGPHIP